MSNPPFAIDAGYARCSFATLHRGATLVRRHRHQRPALETRELPFREQLIMRSHAAGVAHIGGRACW